MKALVKFAAGEGHIDVLDVDEPRRSGQGLHCRNGRGRRTRMRRTSELGPRLLDSLRPMGRYTQIAICGRDIAFPVD